MFQESDSRQQDATTADSNDSADKELTDLEIALLHNPVVIVVERITLNLDPLDRVW